MSEPGVTVITANSRVYDNTKGIAGKLLIVDTIPHNQLAAYAKDIDIPASLIGNANFNVTTVIEGERFVVPTFEIENYVVDKLTKYFFHLLDSAIPADPNNERFNHIVSEPISIINGISDTFAKLEHHRLIARNIICSPNMWEILKELGPNFVDEEPTGRKTLWTAEIHIEDISDNIIYVASSPEFIGVLPIRYEDHPNISTQYGMSILGPKSIAKLIVSSTTPLKPNNP